jgi:prepilin-type N-terminal cleavage/methylation domain-containing protein
MFTTRKHGLTLIEVLIAMFILSLGIVGVLGAMPTGINAAQLVILQDCAIHLAHSKFSEFRRDRVNPSVDLLDGSTYMNNCQEVMTGSPGGWRGFKHGLGDTYQYFDDIDRYEWKVDQTDLAKGVTAGMGASPPAPAGYYAPVNTNGGGGLRVVTIVVRNKGSSKEFQFTQYIGNIGRVDPLDKITP